MTQIYEEHFLYFQALNPKSIANISRPELCYSETKHSDWILEVTWVVFTNQRALFHNRVVNLLEFFVKLPSWWFLTKNDKVILAQVTFKGTVGEFNNYWQHCKNDNTSI